MEIINMRFAGLVSLIFVVVAVLYGVVKAWRGWRKDRAEVEEFDASMNRIIKEEYEWKPRIQNGVDVGEWVPKDGKSG
jgi:hypothetical protein